MKEKYSYKWILQRATAFILIPLTFWFIYHFISFQNSQYFEIKLFFKSTFNSFLFLIMMISILIHSKIGCDTVVQDYISRNLLKNFFMIIINTIS